jgi:phosphatidylglycerophosphate synthase
MDEARIERRPIRARQTRWAAALTGWLLRAGVRPNQVSLLSVAFAALAGLCLLLSPTARPLWGVALLIVAGGFILLRMLCNLLDGMLAVEGGLQSKSGAIFNDVPDRLADSLIFVCAGYAISWVGWGRDLGWLAGLLATLTAYVRVLGGAVGLPQDYSGPMAKPQRMGVMVAACLFGMVEAAVSWGGYVLTLALGIVVVGCVATIARRLRRSVRALESR